MNGEYYNIDCMELMGKYPDKYFDLAIVDPPYGININISIGRRKGNKKSLYHKFSGEDKITPNKNYFNELFRISKNQIIWGMNYFIEYLYSTKNIITWYKKFSNDVSFSACEYAWSNINKTSKIFISSVNVDIIRIHPTQKPVALYKWLLSNYCKHVDLILDTHVGSASSLIACEDMGFKYVACELDKEYYTMSMDRLSKHLAQGKLFDNAEK
jgi:site-specific DNA-methyltransferase (adenine-specific)